MIRLREPRLGIAIHNAVKWIASPKTARDEVVFVIAKPRLGIAIHNAVKWIASPKTARDEVVFVIAKPRLGIAIHNAVVDGKFAGYACGIAFADSAWVREVFIYPTYTESSIAKELVRSLLFWMEEQGALRQLVMAPEATRTFWWSLGFHPDGHLLHYEGGTFLQARKDEVIAMGPEHMLAVLHLDHLATGERRERMLREHMYLGSVYVEEGRVRGFSLPLLGHGLIVADAPEVGLELQRWLLPLQPYLRLPVGHLTAHAHLVARKYTAKPAGIRMVRGRAAGVSATDAIRASISAFPPKKKKAPHRGAFLVGYALFDYLVSAGATPPAPTGSALVAACAWPWPSQPAWALAPSLPAQPAWAFAPSLPAQQAASAVFLPAQQALAGAVPSIFTASALVGWGASAVAVTFSAAGAVFTAVVLWALALARKATAARAVRRMRMVRVILFVAES